MAPNVKGSAVDSRLDFVREIADDAALNRVLDRMSRPHRERIEEGVLASAWVPFELFTELNVAIDAELGEGDLKLVREMGRFSARSNLPTVYRIFLRMGSVHFVLRKASRLWRVHYDSGQLTHEELGDDAGRLTVEGFAAPHRAHCLSVLGWVEGAMCRRVQDRQFLLRPDAVFTAMVTWLLAACALLFDVQVHCATVMSTHVHLVVTVSDQRISELMQHFVANLAKAVSVLRRLRRGVVFEPGGLNIVECKTVDAVVYELAYCT